MGPCALAARRAGQRHARRPEPQNLVLVTRRERAEEKEKEDKALQRELAAINAAAAHAYAGDVMAGHASVQGGPRRGAPPPPPPRNVQHAQQMGKHRESAMEMAMNLAAERRRAASGMPARNAEGGIPQNKNAPPLPPEAPVVYDAGALPVGGDRRPIEAAQDVVDNKTFQPYGQWKTVKKKKTQEERKENQKGNEREKYGIVVNKLPQRKDEDEEEKVSKGDMAGMGVLGSTLGKRGLDAGEDDASFKAVSFKKPKAFRKKKTADYG